MLEDNVAQDRVELEQKALNAAFHLAMKVRSYITALDPDDPMLRNWALRQIEKEFVQLAADVITPILKVEDIDHFEEHGWPRL